MAPEQCRGMPEKASDQYALAIMVYEWLTGYPPFIEGNPINIQYQHIHEPVPPLELQVMAIHLFQVRSYAKSIQSMVKLCSTTCYYRKKRKYRYFFLPANMSCQMTMLPKTICDVKFCPKYPNTYLYILEDQLGRTISKGARGYIYNGAIRFIVSSLMWQLGDNEHPVTQPFDPNL
jgi:serine/threonine protein kinase